MKNIPVLLYYLGLFCHFSYCLNKSDTYWAVLTNHDPAGGIFRVSGDGRKPEDIPDPKIEIGSGHFLTAKQLQSHPNFKYLPSLVECGHSGRISRHQNHSSLERNEYDESEFPKRKRIVGGKGSLKGKHPWMVQLLLLQIGSSQRMFHCAGTIISNTTILTAAHCITRTQTGTTLDVVVVGGGNKKLMQSCKTSDAIENCSREVFHEVDDIEVHQDYSEGNLNNDIGLIYLKRPLNFSELVRPICLPTSESLLESWRNQKLTVVGWGSTDQFKEGHNSDVLKELELDLQLRSTCDKFHVRIYGKTKENRICTGGNSGKATCNGDSGGGVLKKLKVSVDGKLTDRVFQFGIISAGGHVINTCGSQGRPAMDTNVMFYMDWILNHIVPGSQSYFLANRADISEQSWISTNEKSPNQDNVKYKNEFSTGSNVDVSQHPNISLLPSFRNCGSFQLAHTSSITPDIADDIPFIGNSLRKKRIVGGIPTAIEGFVPWMVQIHVRDKTNHVSLRCSGSIITSTAILTAAHCVTETPVPYVLDTVIAGQYNQNSTKECIDDVCYLPQKARITDVIIHPEYEKYTQANNIAIIKLAEELRFTKMVQPVCLPRRESLIDGFRLHRYFTAGWGQVAAKESVNSAQVHSNILLQIYVQLHSRKDCDFLYSRQMYTLGRARLCGGGKAARGECNGDGGSPLMKMVETDKGHPLFRKVFQLGLVAYMDCGVEGMPTIYMNIIYYMGWILDTLGGQTQN